MKIKTGAFSEWWDMPPERDITLLEVKPDMVMPEWVTRLRSVGKASFDIAGTSLVNSGMSSTTSSLGMMGTVGKRASVQTSREYALNTSKGDFGKLAVREASRGYG